ncbi:hypothetical protein [Sporisorium scitamineum]|uniref:Uncharacterized protein n=1 Tax=Sporisorium scitamineum TaxID=49012 RepID=A0A0F7SBM4_9BASI|nr:hypothetical protein [Sporisorium scitamineum]
MRASPPPSTTTTDLDTDMADDTPASMVTLINLNTLHTNPPADDSSCQSSSGSTSN